MSNAQRTEVTVIQRRARDLDDTDVVRISYPVAGSFEMAYGWTEVLDTYYTEDDLAGLEKDWGGWPPGRAVGEAKQVIGGGVGFVLLRVYDVPATRADKGELHWSWVLLYENELVECQDQPAYLKQQTRFGPRHVCPDPAYGPCPRPECSQVTNR